MKRSVNVSVRVDNVMLYSFNFVVLAVLLKLYQEGHMEDWVTAPVLAGVYIIFAICIKGLLNMLFDPREAK